MREQLRRAYGCGCRGPLVGRRYSTRSGDLVAGIREGGAIATGRKPPSCPWSSLADPFVDEVIRAHRWWKAGGLGERSALPAALVRGVEVYDAALNATQVHDQREDAEQRRRESAKREQERARAPRLGKGGRIARVR